MCRKSGEIYLTYIAGELAFFTEIYVKLRKFKTLFIVLK